MGMTAIDIAVTVVRDEAGRVLLAERTARQISAGFWELPGGKIDPGETPHAAAARELDEEVGIRAESLHPLMTYDHVFPTKRVRLHIFRVTRWSGAPHGREGQRVAWVDPASPEVAPVLPSNLRVLAALGLPPVMGVFDLFGDATSMLDQVQDALAGGARLLLLRAAHWAPDQRVSVARRICVLAHRYGATTLLAGSALEADRAGAGGVHSEAKALCRMHARPPVRLWSVACHGEDDLKRAQALGADLAMVSPVLACGTRPLLGWEGMRRLSAATPIPLYAKGGLDVGHLGQALQAGAAGIAVNGACLAHTLPNQKYAVN
jgi:8-oxo-dGTP diphosphatase